MTSHPCDISLELMQAVRDLPSLCELVHFPIQAGSNRVLKKMHRMYTKEEYLEKVATLRSLVPRCLPWPRLVIAVLLALVSLGPLLYMLSLSFQPNGGLLGATVLIPTHPTVQNYVQAWTENSFSHYFFNSLLVAIATVAITVMIASLAAFAFARYRFPLKQVIFYVFLASLAVPNLLLLIPQFLLMDRLHLLNSLEGLVLLYVASNLPFTIFLLRGFFEAIPRSTRRRSAWKEPGRCVCSST